MQSYLLNPIIPAECKLFPVYQSILKTRLRNKQVLSVHYKDKGKNKLTTCITETSS